MPLQITNPDHQIGNGSCAWVKLNAQKLRRVHLVDVEPELGLPGDILQALQHLRFELLDQVQRHIQKVARAAGRVEDAGLPQFCEKGF